MQQMTQAYHLSFLFLNTDDKYYVGLDFAFNLDIRPRNLSGVILAIHNPVENGDFILLQLVDGKVGKSSIIALLQTTVKLYNPLQLLSLV